MPPPVAVQQYSQRFSRPRYFEEPIPRRPFASVPLEGHHPIAHSAQQRTDSIPGAHRTTCRICGRPCNPRFGKCRRCKIQESPVHMCPRPGCTNTCRGVQCQPCHFKFVACISCRRYNRQMGASYCAHCLRTSVATSQPTQKYYSRPRSTQSSLAPLSTTSLYAADHNQKDSYSRHHRRTPERHSVPRVPIAEESHSNHRRKRHRYNSRRSTEPYKSTPRAHSRHHRRMKRRRRRPRIKEDDSGASGDEGMQNMDLSEPEEGEVNTLTNDRRPDEPVKRRLQSQIASQESTQSAKDYDKTDSTSKGPSSDERLFIPITSKNNASDAQHDSARRSESESTNSLYNDTEIEQQQVHDKDDEESEASSLEEASNASLPVDF